MASVPLGKRYRVANAVSRGCVTAAGPGRPATFADRAAQAAVPPSWNRYQSFRYAKAGILRIRPRPSVPVMVASIGRTTSPSLGVGYFERHGVSVAQTTSLPCAARSTATASATSGNAAQPERRLHDIVVHPAKSAGPVVAAWL